VSPGKRTVGVRWNPYLAFIMPALLLVGALYLLPLGWLAYASLGRPNEFTLRWYEQIAAPTGIHNMLWTTARIVAVTSVVALLLGYVVALAMVHASKRARVARPER
jgi:putative spermidine/putrescine transport system permease protein